jgi:hypothetical protein
MIALRRHRSLVILVAVLALFVGVDEGHNGCDPTPNVHSTR